MEALKPSLKLISTPGLDVEHNAIPVQGSEYILYTLSFVLNPTGPVFQCCMLNKWVVSGDKARYSKLE